MKSIYSNEKFNQAAAFYIRIEVFVKEQGVPFIDEFTCADTDDKEYLFIYDGDIPVATAYINKFSDSLYQIDRVAVLASHRGLGLGDRLISELLPLVSGDVFLHAELDVVDFYAKYGFKTTGDVFLEDGIEVIKMSTVF
ncbi:MAG: GNAT family N-acetyltransferase [Lactobacillales bacterium]|jgi:predicted GNAT family N-acyltransferase|nr:GNAT family N-acetyltransferase [Lactobacillales bacterium]